MKRKIVIKDEYLYIPIYTGQKEEEITFSIQREDTTEKILELLIPVDCKREEEYNGDYMAEIPMHQFVGETVLIEGNFPAVMGMKIENRDKKYYFTSGRPKVHFTPERGWCNDPNGMVYYNGLYHMFFQYNPFDIKWNNMSWGHAISKDLLHWAQINTVMFPDEGGTMFSGCGLINERGLLDLPEDALLFYYTEAGGTNAWSEGKEFTQKIAYSLDEGASLTKIKEPCIDTIYHDNRDPKIFWHEETQAYIMVLWLKGNSFGIFRSVDLKKWDLQQEIELEEGWECPDLFHLTSETGEKKWFFWSADGHYYPGDFDGYQFVSQGERNMAYLNKIPYAAQTMSGIEDRVISIPWLRFENDGRLFTGAYGIPVELSFTRKGINSYIKQKPVKEFYDALTPIDADMINLQDGRICLKEEKENTVFICDMILNDNNREIVSWNINGSTIQYTPSSGLLVMNHENYQAGLEHKKIEIIVDADILEIVFDDGMALGTFKLKERKLSFSMSEKNVKSYSFYEIKE